jgi:hypothetical protein
MNIEIKSPVTEFRPTQYYRRKSHNILIRCIYIICIPHIRVSRENYTSVKILPGDVCVSMSVKKSRGRVGRHEFPDSLHNIEW